MGAQSQRRINPHLNACGTYLISPSPSEEKESPSWLWWVPTKLNVADDETRGLSTGFDETHRWFHDFDLLRNTKMNGCRKRKKCFEKETTLIREGKAVTRRSRLRKLAMEINENGILRRKERIKAAMYVSSTLNGPAALSDDNSIPK
ncbi:hypothetical protein EVAR_84640_1 [Eumeta japonica]|uniref:Uncharacterized protein n=1 Tax=Eumeta variegata TaxID=151549 RepID=A0A4C1UYJ3_EUMVA|nr:hypothetical protein EVAR_84640_1 [Eumeta japonica]